MKVTFARTCARVNSQAAADDSSDELSSSDDELNLMSNEGKELVEVDVPPYHGAEGTDDDARVLV